MGRFVPFAHQEECLAATAQARREGKRSGLVIMATGLGKTVTAAFDAKEYLQGGGRTLFLCHQNDILRQSRATFNEVFDGAYSMASLHGGASDYQMLHKAHCVFASFQTMTNWLDVFPEYSFDYIVVDEGHHLPARTYRRVLDHFKPEFVLGMTATPERGDLQDIRSLYGEEIYNLPLEEALARALLTPVDYRLVSPDIDPAVLESLPDHLSIRDLDQILFAPRENHEILRILTEHTQQVKNCRMMVFCSSIKQCEEWAAYIPDSVAVHSGQRRKIQDAGLEAFRTGEIGTILSVDKLNEGIDVPEANVVVFLRSTASRTIFLQQLGRGLRQAEGKEKVLVLDFAGNCERVEMVTEIWKNVEDRAKRQPRAKRPREPKPERESLSVDFGNIEFSLTSKNIIEIIRRTRATQAPVYSPDEMTAMLQELGSKLDRLPSVTMLSEHGLPPAHVFARVFGSWPKALLAAGFFPRGIVLSVEELLDLVRQLAQELGRELKMEDLQDAARRGKIPSLTTYQYTIGGPRRVLKLAGQVSEAVEAPDNSKDELIAKLRALGSKLDRAPKISDLAPNDLPPSNLFVKLFGSWSRAVEAAGYVPHGARYSREELLDQIRTVADRVYDPTTEHVIPALWHDSLRSKAASMYRFERTFGSVEKACLEAGVPMASNVVVMTKGGRYTRAKLIWQLRSLSFKLGRIPTVPDVIQASKERKTASHSMYYSFFGSFRRALFEAGLTKEEPAKRKRQN